MPKGSRHEWQNGIRKGHVTDGPWTCDCPDYGLDPQPGWLGECQTCRRPIYGPDGTRITRSHTTTVPTHGDHPTAD